MVTFFCAIAGTPRRPPRTANRQSSQPIVSCSPPWSLAMVTASAESRSSPASCARCRRCCRYALFSAISGGATIAQSPVVLRCRPLSNSFFWNAWPRWPGAPSGCDVDGGRSCRSRGCRRRRGTSLQRPDARRGSTATARAPRSNRPSFSVDVERGEARGARRRMRRSTCSRGRTRSRRPAPRP